MTFGNSIDEKLRILIINNLFSRYGKDYLQQRLGEYTTPEEQIEPLIQHILKLFETNDV